MGLEDEVVNNEEEVLEDMSKNSDNIHIHKTTKGGSEVNIDAKNEDNENEKVNVTFSGINIKGKDGKEVNVRFLPWVIFGVCFILAIIGLVLFTIYNIFKLFV